MYLVSSSFLSRPSKRNKNWIFGLTPLIVLKLSRKHFHKIPSFSKARD